MTDQPTSALVGSMYDQQTDLLTDAWGDCIHLGYWDDLANEQAIETAADRMTSVVADKLTLTPGQRILDVGCGTGKPALQIATGHDVHVTGITVSNYQVELAQARLAKSTQPEQASFQLADVKEMPFADASFDGAFAIESLCHIAEKSTALAQIARVLRPGSRLVITDVFLEGTAEDPDAEALERICQMFQAPSCLTADEYRDLFHRAGLTIIEFTNVRHNVQPGYKNLAAALRQKALALDGDAAEKLRSAAPDVEQFAKLGYAIITAVRT